jgi:hypothetical protein
MVTVCFNVHFRFNVHVVTVSLTIFVLFKHDSNFTPTVFDVGDRNAIPKIVDPPGHILAAWLVGTGGNHPLGEFNYTIVLERSIDPYI